MVQSCYRLGFASVACPSGVSPSSPFCGADSGTWASIVYTISQGLQVFVFPASSAPMPSWPGGQWLQAVPSGLWACTYVWQPTANQLSLF
ncbi:MAG TPA: hypothetical protein V6C96_00940 [Vampirovibrionales bacterium]